MYVHVFSYLFLYIFIHFLFPTVNLNWREKINICFTSLSFNISNFEIILAIKNLLLQSLLSQETNYVSFVVILSPF